LVFLIIGMYTVPDMLRHPDEIEEEPVFDYKIEGEIDISDTDYIVEERPSVVYPDDREIVRGSINNTPSAFVEEDDIEDTENNNFNIDRGLVVWIAIIVMGMFVLILIILRILVYKSNKKQDEVVL